MPCLYRSLLPRVAQLLDWAKNRGGGRCSETWNYQKKKPRPQAEIFRGPQGQEEEDGELWSRGLRGREAVSESWSRGLRVGETVSHGQRA